MAKALYEQGFTQNREISWLRFNNRVLDEAKDPSVPLFERMKFAAIHQSNLDEFFAVRVGSLYEMRKVSPSLADSKSGLTAKQQLDQIYSRARKEVGGQAVLGRQGRESTPWLTERHGYDPTLRNAEGIAFAG